LALAIGANTLIVSAVEAVLLRPLAVPRLDRVVTIGRADPARDLHLGMQPAEVFSLEERRDLFDAVAGYRAVDLNLTGLAAPLHVAAVSTTGGFFDVFNVPPYLGRFYHQEDERRGATNVVVLSFELWRDLTGSDVNAIGRVIDLNDSSFTVIGVLPPRFAYPLGTQIWTPKTLDIFLDRHASGALLHGGSVVPTVARMAIGVSLPRLEAELAATLRDWEMKEPQYYRKRASLPIEVRAFVAVWAGPLRAILVALFGAVALVLLIACANVGSLYLLRTSGRAREIAVRLALGGSRAAIVRQFAIEALLLASCAGVVGIGIAEVLVATARRRGGIDVPELYNLRLDPFVLACSAGVTVLAAVLFGVGPALRAGSADPRDALAATAGRGQSFGAARSRFLRSAVVTQIALAFVLAMSCGVAVRSMVRLLQVDPGFDPSNVLVAHFVLPRSRYDFMTLDGSKRALALHESLLSRLRATRGIDAATTTDVPPFGYHGLLDAATRRTAVTAQIGPDAGRNSIAANSWNVDAGYFNAMRIPWRAGPGFTGQEQEDQVRAYPKQLQVSVVIDEMLARRLFPGRSAVGQLIGPHAPGLRVVGVVGNVKKSDLSSAIDDAGAIYFATAGTQPAQTLIVRTHLPLSAASTLLRRTVQDVDPSLPLFGIEPLETLIARSVGPRQIASRLLLVFAGLALSLALLGVYGVLSYTASQRIKEIGIRLALGAAPREVGGSVLRSGLTLTIVGLLVGTASYALFQRGLSAITYGVSPNDPVMIVVGIAVLLLAAVLAMLPAATRAASVNPTEALRAD
jgi:predicted permease